MPRVSTRSSFCLGAQLPVGHVFLGRDFNSASTKASIALGSKVALVITSDVLGTQLPEGNRIASSLICLHSR